MVDSFNRYFMQEIYPIDGRFQLIDLRPIPSRLKWWLWGSMAMHSALQEIPPQFQVSLLESH